MEERKKERKREKERKEERKKWRSYQLLQKCSFLVFLLYEQLCVGNSEGNCCAFNILYV